MSGIDEIPLMDSSVALCSREEILVLRAENAILSFANFAEQNVPAQRDHHARATERKAKAGDLGDPGLRAAEAQLKPASRHLAGWSAFRASDLGSAVSFRVQYSSSAI